jgi:hypothetical protein
VQNLLRSCQVAQWCLVCCADTHSHDTVYGIVAYSWINLADNSLLIKGSLVKQPILPFKTGIYSVQLEVYDNCPNTTICNDDNSVGPRKATATGKFQVVAPNAVPGCFQQFYTGNYMLSLHQHHLDI